MKLWHQIVELETRNLVDEVRDGRLRIAGRAGGPAWDTDRRAALFADLERGWPAWPMLAWNPSGQARQPSYLLDGHRLVATLMANLTDEAGLVRDLTTTEPTYRPADHIAPDGMYWPVNALVWTMPFLRRQRAVRHAMPAALVDRAEQVAQHLVTAQFRILTLFGGDPATVAAISERLLPGRVTPATLAQISAEPAQ